MVRIAASLAAVLPLAAAFPSAMEMNAKLLARADSSGTNLHRKNTGVAHPVVPFNAKEQYVDVTDGSAHEFREPGPTDLRGECPGLNAVANHGFFPRNGVVTVQQTIDGLRDAYGMTPELAAALAVIAILIGGDLPTGTWSIGRGQKNSLPGLLSNPKGIVGMHNKYEGDASIVRGDAYLNNGNVGVFQYASWQKLMDAVDENLNDQEDRAGNLSPYKATMQNVYTREFSKQNNPYYFSGEFSGLVTSAVRGFVYGFMSNHTAENPTGYLDKNILKSFFAVTGDKEGEYQVHYGMERIPLNWYKRPYGIAGEYGHSLANVFQELAASASEFPGSLEIGGNTGSVNSFQGVDLSDLTGGVFRMGAFTDPTKLACFAYQAAMQVGVDQFDGGLQELNSVITGLAGQFSAAFAQFECPQLHGFNSQLFNLFPGYNYTGDPTSNSGDGKFGGDGKHPQ